MAYPIDEKQVRALLAESVSQNEIARRLQIPPTTLKRYIKKLHDASPAHHDTPSPPQESTPEVHINVHLPGHGTASPDDLADLLMWWRERKQLTQTSVDPERETERKTYHVEKRHIAAIERAADLERVSITEIVNHAFQHYFAKR